MDHSNKRNQFIRKETNLLEKKQILGQEFPKKSLLLSNEEGLEGENKGKGG